MKALDSIMEAESEKMAQAMSEKFRDEIKENIANEFYDRMQIYLYEHYMNLKSRIEADLIRELSDRFIKNPSDYKFKELRDKLWTEHRNEISSAITEEQIGGYLDGILSSNISKEMPFAWKWKDGIAKYILTNWDQFKDDQRISLAFGRDRDNLLSLVNTLNRKFDALRLELSNNSNES